MEARWSIVERISDKDVVERGSERKQKEPNN
jgi:hypothetical protein